MIWVLMIFFSKYQDVIEEVFKNRVSDLGEDSLDDDIPFCRDDIEESIDDLGVDIGNVPDIPYSYRSRKNLPDSISKHGFDSVIIDDDRHGSDPTYLFTKESQIVQVSDEVDNVRKTSVEVLPEAVRDYVGEDEQGILTQVRYADILDDFVGMDTYHLTSHLRFRVRGREAELDDMYIGVDDAGTEYSLAVEAKGKGEKINRNQLVRNTIGIENKDKYPDRVKTLAVKLDESGSIYILEFNVHDFGVKKCWEYNFE